MFYKFGFIIINILLIKKYFIKNIKYYLHKYNTNNLFYKRNSKYIDFSGYDMRKLKNRYNSSIYSFDNNTINLSERNGDKELFSGMIVEENTENTMNLSKNLSIDKKLFYEVPTKENTEKNYNENISSSLFYGVPMKENTEKNYNESISLAIFPFTNISENSSLSIFGLDKFIVNKEILSKLLVKINTINSMNLSNNIIDKKNFSLTLVNINQKKIVNFSKDSSSLFYEESYSEELSEESISKKEIINKIKIYFYKKKILDKLKNINLPLHEKLNIIKNYNKDNIVGNIMNGNLMKQWNFEDF
jgi:hypothetical protein